MGMKDLNKGFPVLARYIGVFGDADNKSRDGVGSQKMAMTAPVVCKMDGADGNGDTSAGSMAFVLPEDIEHSRMAPLPNNQRVELRDVPSRLVAVHTFTGSVNEECGKRMRELMVKSVASHGLVQDNDCVSPELCFYNPPYTLPWCR